MVNVFGIVFVVLIMIPNIIFTVLKRRELKNLCTNKTIIVFEQIGKLGCLCFMILILPSFNFGFSSKLSFALYFFINGILAIAYILICIICFKKNSVFRTLSLSIIPSVIFLLSGILSRYLPLIISSLIFVPCSIIISYKKLD